MTKSMKLMLIVGTVLLAAGLIGLGLMTPATADGRVAAGVAAPEFAAMTLEPPVKTRGLIDYRGEVLLLNVWATWCHPCVEEMPTMQAVHEAYADRGLRVVAVSVDDAGSEQLIRDFQKEYRLTFEILHDPEWQIFDAYMMNGVPTTFLIDREGVIRLVRFAEDWASPESRAEIERLLGD